MGPRRIPPHFVAGFRAVMPLWLGVVPFGLVYAVLARDAGLSLARDAVAVRARVRRQRPGERRRAVRNRSGRPRDRLDHVPAERPARALRTVARPAHPALAAGAARRPPTSSRTRRSGSSPRAEERTFAFLLGAELSLFATWNAATLAGRARRHGDHRPCRARHRSGVPARLHRAPRAARPDACRARGRRRVGSDWPTSLSQRLPGGLADPAHRRRRKPARGIPHARSAGRRHPARRRRAGGRVTSG